MSIDSIVVAGGKASRLGGVDKVMMPLADSGQSLLQAVVAQCPGRVVVVGPKRNVVGVDSWVDDSGELGPASGIWYGLAQVNTEYVFICAGDQVLQSGTVTRISKAAQSHDGAWAVRADGTGQPLCAVVKTELIRELLAPTQGAHQSPLKLMSTLDMQPVTVNEGDVDDVDTWDDVRRLAQKAGVLMSQAWLDVVGAVLGVDAADVPVDDLLDLTRDVAHNVERKYAPLTTFMLGVAVGQGEKSVEELISAVNVALEEFGVSGQRSD